MNNLLYNARMALRDLIEVNISTKGADRVFLTVFSDLIWEGDGPETAEQREQRERAGRAHTENVIKDAVSRLRDMDMVLAGGEDAVSALMESEPVEILRKAA